MKQLLQRALGALGYQVVPRARGPQTRPRYPALPPDVAPEDGAILRRVADFTMTGIERPLALLHAVRYLAHRGVAGSIVECGVWKGGSMMATALALMDEGDSARDLYLYDTFEGMSPPTDADATTDGTPASVHLDRDEKGTGYWCRAGIDEVRANMASTGYPEARIHYVKGPVEQTIPEKLPPGPVALLRLDTDWYESTRHELIHLFPLLAPGGVLIVDDYGHWQGAKKAVDEYLATLPRVPYLHRIDYTGRLLIKE
jgi:O-methyltransferase